jgi:hypothetical protein
VLRNVNDRIDREKQNNRLLNVICFVRRLDRQHAITDGFADVLFLLVTGPPVYHPSMRPIHPTHGTVVQSHSHEVDSGAGVDDRAEQNRKDESRNDQ